MGYTLTSKRQVTVPIQVFEFLGIGPRRDIEYVTLDDGRVLIRSVPEQRTVIQSALDKWRGKSVLKNRPKTQCAKLVETRRCVDFG
jgi:bifunctional DNA-binding transcriptional regulator/antitoxin component of YhaV-PrlF toxin-antitoxin module